MTPRHLRQCWCGKPAAPACQTCDGHRYQQWVWTGRREKEGHQ